MATHLYFKEWEENYRPNARADWLRDFMKSYDERTLGPDPRSAPEPKRCHACNGRKSTVHLEMETVETTGPEVFVSPQESWVPTRAVFRQVTEECPYCNGTGVTWYGKHVHQPECFTTYETCGPGYVETAFCIHRYRVEQDFYLEQMQISYAIQMIEGEE